MKLLKLISLGVLGLTLATNLNAKIKVGVITGTEAEVYSLAGKIAKEKYNLDVEFVLFNDYVTPNLALAGKQLDANAIQTIPFLDKVVADRKLKIVQVAKTFVYPIAAYSTKVKNVAELKDGATIAIPNDPATVSRSLLLLQAQGLIKLKDPKGLSQNQLDIVENPKKIKLLEVDSPLIPRMLDQVDAAVINTTYSSQHNLLPTRDGIFLEGNDSPYVNIIAAREDNKDSVEIQQFIKAFQTDAVNELAQQKFQGSVVKGW